MKESIGAWKNTCHVLMHTQGLIPLKLWHVSLSVYHNSVKSSVWQSAAMQLSHLTHWTLHEIHLEVQVIGCLQAGQGLWRHSEEWMRRLPVAAAPKPSETFTGLVLKTFTLLEFWPHTSRNSDHLALTPSANGKREEFRLQGVNLSICGL